MEGGWGLGLTCWVGGLEIPDQQDLEITCLAIFSGPFQRQKQWHHKRLALCCRGLLGQFQGHTGEVTAGATGCRCRLGDSM